MVLCTRVPSQERKPNQVMAINISLRLFVVVYNIEVVLCTSVPILIVRNAKLWLINNNLQVLLPEAVCCCLHTCKSCMVNVFVGIPL